MVLGHPEADVNSVELATCGFIGCEENIVLRGAHQHVRDPPQLRGPMSTRWPSSNSAVLFSDIKQCSSAQIRKIGDVVVVADAMDGHRPLIKINC